MIPLSLSLAVLDGMNGFILNGITAYDYSGYSVSRAGDVNGDGIEDLIIGAYNATANGNKGTGQSYVVFGSRAGFPSVLNLSTLNGSNGFTINGIAANDLSGYSVSRAGDVNGDEIDDLIIGSYGADANDRKNDRENAGQSYVVFGSRAGFPSVLNLSTLNGSNGFTINGIAANDFCGYSVSHAGDVNGDGIDDLTIGAYNAQNGAGQSYVVFGRRSGFSSPLNLSTLDGTNGFTIDGITANDGAGISLSGAGDVNGDGVADLIIGASGADPRGQNLAGQSYVVFGSRAGFPAVLKLSTLAGSDGFALNGIAINDRLGASVSGAGDVNGDGIDDLILGAPGIDASGGETYGNSGAGQSYVIFGSRSSYPANIDLSALNGTNGFTINGIAANDRLGSSVSSAGDVNEDGIDDLIIGALNAQNGAGQSYVVFGSRSPYPANIDLSTLNGTNGFTINGFAANDRLGSSVNSAGDVNGDGIDDLIIGAANASPNGNRGAGQSYVVFGRKTGFPAVLNFFDR